MLSRRRRTAGFSTMDVLAGMGLTFILLAAIYGFQQMQLKSLSAQTIYADSQNVTRSVIDTMARELRMASYDPGTALPVSPGPCAPGVKQGIVEATPTKLHFRQDLDGDGALSAPGEDVTYDILADSIRRTDGANPPVTLASGVATNGLTFQYFNNANPPQELVPSGSPAVLSACQRDSVTKVRVTILSNLRNPNPNVQTPIASLAATEVAIRNRSLDTL
jgi:hypothetical protein